MLRYSELPNVDIESYVKKKKVKNKHRIITRKVDEKHKHRTLYELNHHIVTRWDI